MPDPGLVLLAVDSPAASAAFYAALTGQQPVDSSPAFAMFVFPSGTRLGLWSRHTMTPRPAVPGGAELAFEVADVDATHADWTARGMPILQPPADLDFGRTFVALDPDGHRLRAFTPGPG